jgi:rRNA-processing protein FCF1
VLRGLAVREEVRRTGGYYTPEFVIAELEAIQANTEAAPKK